MGCRVPQPVCQVTNTVVSDPGTLTCGRTPKPGTAGLSPHLVPPGKRILKYDVLVFDNDAIIAFLRSVARAKATEKHLHVQWKSYNESTTLNVIYTVLWWKGKPGIVEVDTGKQAQIELETKEDSQHLLEVFLEKASAGAEKAVRFLKLQEEIRNRCQQTVQDTFNEVREMNREMVEEAHKAVVKLAVIKAAATIGVKTIGLATLGPPAFLISTGYDVTLSIIKDWDKADGGMLVGVTSKAGEDLAQEKIEKGAEKIGEEFEKEAEEHAKKAEWLEKRITKMEEDLAKKARADQLKKLAKDSRRLARASQDAARAKWASRAFSTVKYLFYAKEVFEAVHDAREEIESGE